MQRFLSNLPCGVRRLDVWLGQDVDVATSLLFGTPVGNGIPAPIPHSVRVLRLRVCNFTVQLMRNIRWLGHAGDGCWHVDTTHRQANLLHPSELDWSVFERMNA